MKTLFEILMWLATLSSTSSTYFDELNQAQQKLESSLLRLENAQLRLEAKEQSLLRFQKDNWQQEIAFFEQKAQELKREKGILELFKSHLQKVQEENAVQEMPISPIHESFEEIPLEIQENMAQGSLFLPTATHKAPSSNTGGAGYGPGFSRACPAFDENRIEGFVSMIEGNGSMETLGSSGLRIPSTSGYISAGTWAYPSGALHLGMDLALPMYTPLYAPADGVILYAATPVGDAGGYLGNWSGWPYGGGNTICMLCLSNGRLYGISFCHLSSRVVVRASQMVRQGDILAYSGNTGNSTGPHTHIELFDIQVSFQEAVAYFQRSADFSFGTGWTTPATCSAIGCRRRPELYFVR